MVCLCCEVRRIQRMICCASRFQISCYKCSQHSALSGAVELASKRDGVRVSTELCDGVFMDWKCSVVGTPHIRRTMASLSCKGCSASACFSSVFRRRVGLLTAGFSGTNPACIHEQASPHPTLFGIPAGAGWPYISLLAMLQALFAGSIAGSVLRPSLSRSCSPSPLPTFSLATISKAWSQSSLQAGISFTSWDGMAWRWGLNLEKLGCRRVCEVMAYPWNLQL